MAQRQVDAWELAERGPDTVRDYLRFLDATDRLHPASLRKGDRPAVIAALGLPAPSGPSGPSGLRGDDAVLDRLWRLAIELDVIQLRRTRVVPGSGAKIITDALAGTGESEQVLGLWTDIADALIHPSDPRNGAKDTANLRDWLRPWAPWFLGLLYGATAAGAPADLDDLTDQLLDAHNDRLPPAQPDLFAGLAAAAVRTALADLASHGAVTVTGVPENIDPRRAAAAAVLGTAPWAVEGPPGLVVDLTDLGRYLVRVRLLEEGAHAPLAA
ncbi:hypothetical protein UG55_10085 [Frankia sp. EI5c]|uniref:hypothetical protein n=1 Tax=Frankia sp. EI5c TaxID=683316 RepID=UPI0007C39DE7|nr:hypothetical protein [Frankia sp. EI5c]OAA27354.1 hypothetical protein UG55_10085 [Frankia sp. EI5c]